MGAILKSRHCWQIISGLAIALLLSTNVQADDFAVSSNPYAPIMVRNVFGLLPIPTNPPADQEPPAMPPPKITPNGIMSIFGKLEVLFKVAVPARGNQPAKDESHVMGEGERENDIEVTKIDEKSAVITFNNHGSVQELPLANAPSLTTPAAGVVPAFTGIPAPNGSASGVAFGGRFGGRGRPPTSNGTGTSSGTTPGYGSTPKAAANINTQEQEKLSPEAQVLLVEKNYLDAKANNDSSAVLFPTTPLRQQSDADTGGSIVP